jgi:hypothetical protein
MRTPALPITLVVLALGVLASTGCGTEGKTASATTVVERVTVPAEATTSEPADATAKTSSEDSGSASSSSGGGKDSSDASDAASSSSEADCVEVPDVVGLSDLQLSQDTLQAAGFYVMDQEDATGQGRAQLLDRNWVVTRQDPKAGECVDTSTTITTYAKKHGE